MTLQLRWGARTDRGRVRAINEDAFVATAPVFVVADGMGGHAAGEVASALTVDCFRALAGPGSAPAEDVLGALGEANDRILEHAASSPTARGMGTTVTGLVVVQNGPAEELLAFNVGDSRLYRIRGEDVAQVSVDHSAVQELVDAGLIAPEQAAVHPDRHIVTQALGSNPPPRPDVWFIAPAAGDRFVLCTDGLSGEVPLQELGRLSREIEDPGETADQLVEAALRAGGRDNVTVLVVDVVEVSGDAGPDESTAPRASLTAENPVLPTDLAGNV